MQHNINNGNENHGDADNNNNNNGIDDGIEARGEGDDENHGNPVENFEDAFDWLEEIVQGTRAEFVQVGLHCTENFEQSWAELGLGGLQGVDELNPACMAMLNSLESWDRFIDEWNVNRQRLLDSMRNCPAFQGIRDHPQG